MIQPLQRIPLATLLSIMSRLPPEVITRIFEFIRESESADGLDYEFTEAYHRFFDNASLVSKGFSLLALPFRQCYTIPNNTAGLPLEKWEGGYARNGEQLVQAIPVKTLHVDQKGCDDDDPDYVLALPNRFRSLLIAAEHTISSISLQVDFLQLDIPKNCLGTDAVLQRILKQVARLHVYSDAEQDTNYCIPDGEFVVSGADLPWRSLAISAWGPGRTLPLKELSISMVAIDCPFTDDEDEIIPCPAKTVILKDVYMEKYMIWSEYFPTTERLALIQTRSWWWTSDPMYPPTSLSPFDNLVLDASSTCIRHFEASWQLSTPIPGLLCPLRGNTGILNSPNLLSVSLEGSLDIALPSIAFVPDLLLKPDDLAGFTGPKLLHLSIRGIEHLLPREDVIKMCSNFVDPRYMPAIRSIPVLTVAGKEMNSEVSYEEKVHIRKGFQALLERGLTFVNGEMEGTLWELATECQEL